MPPWALPSKCWDCLLVPGSELTELSVLIWTPWCNGPWSSQATRSFFSTLGEIRTLTVHGLNVISLPGWNTRAWFGWKESDLHNTLGQSQRHYHYATPESCGTEEIRTLKPSPCKSAALPIGATVPLEPTLRIGLRTSNLPCSCSTTELGGRVKRKVEGSNLYVLADVSLAKRAFTIQVNLPRYPWRELNSHLRFRKA